MESTTKAHQTPQQPSGQRDLDTDLVSSSHNAPLKTKPEVLNEKKPCLRTNLHQPHSTKCFQGALAMVNDLDHGSCDIVKPTCSYDRQQHASTPSLSLESAKGMNAAFYICLQSGQIDSLERMLEDEENLLDQVTIWQNTALHIVARQGLHQLIKPILSRRPGLLTHQNANGDTALHLAAQAGHLTSVKSMEDFVGDVKWECLCEMKNDDGDTALHVAVKHRQTGVTIFLMSVHPKASYCLNRSRKSPLFLAAELGELQIVKDMISMFDANDAQGALEEGKSAIHAAILGGNSGVLESILSKCKSIFSSAAIEINGIKVSTLTYAALKGNIQMVRYILTEFPDSAYISDKGMFPIHIAVAKGHKMVLKEFLKFQPDSRELLNLKGRNIMHIAAFYGKDDVVSYILSKPVFDDLINAQDFMGNTPLHCAVIAKFPKVVNALTWDKRVQLDLVNNDGCTPMDEAMKPVPNLEEQLTWMALRFAGAPRGNFQQAKRSNEWEQATSQVETSNELEQATSPVYKDRVNTLSVVATLVTTMSFAAGFTMPGGNNGSKPDHGMAVFLQRRILQLFVISNSIALYTSVLDVLVLIFAMLGDVKVLQVTLIIAVPLLATSLATMSIAFMSAVYLVVSNLRWLGIVIWVLGSAYLLVVMALFFLLFAPLSANNQFTRYLAYPLFRAMLYISEKKLRQQQQPNLTSLIMTQFSSSSPPPPPPPPRFASPVL